MLPLTTADLLAQAIIGSVLENLDLESLVQREHRLQIPGVECILTEAQTWIEIGQQVADRLGSNVTEDSIDAVAQ